MTMPSAKIEEYLEAIYNMEMEGESIIGARLAEKFQVKAPTVTEMLQRLEKADYITMDHQRHVYLTASGIELAESVLRRHRLTERFLMDMLGMQWHEVHDEACRLEHYISGAVEKRVVASLGNPTTCPHGNPIPGYVEDARGYLSRHHAQRLPETGGETMRILCISEVVEDEEATIKHLHEIGLTPGTALTFLEIQDDLCKVQVNGQSLTLPFWLARLLWVIPANAEFPQGASDVAQHSITPHEPLTDLFANTIE
jgi:DtxR family transcriptional regulator, Mn-dependent transcriptional regulator